MLNTEDEEFKIIFEKLSKIPYESHWWIRVPVELVLEGGSSDCSDRAYALADYCEKNNIPYSFILTLFNNPLSLHMALVVDGLVYDPMLSDYAMAIKDYKKFLGGFYSRVFGSWIQKIIP